MSPKKKVEATKTNKPTRPAIKIKKTPDRPLKRQNFTQKLDFLKWLKMFSTGLEQERLQDAISDVSTEFQGLASELIAALLPEAKKPTSSFKLEKLPIEFLDYVGEKITSPFYAIAFLCSPVTNLEMKKSTIRVLSQKNLNNGDIEYLLGKMNQIKDLSIKEAVWNEFLSSGILSSESWKAYQLQFLDWGISNNLSLLNPINTLIGLRQAADQFKELETPKKNRIYRRLIENDIFMFIVFVLHVSYELNSDKFIEQIIGNKNVEVLLIYSENRQSLNGPWLENFERNFISPLLKKTIDSIMQFEDLLPFLIRHSLFAELLPTDTLTRAVSRSFKRKDNLSHLLGDTRIAVLERNIEVLTAENLQISRDLAVERSQNKQQEVKIREFEAAIENYESRLRSQINAENRGSDAMSQNSKIELLKSIVEGLDHLLNGSDGFQLERALQKLGVLRLGVPGEDFLWDSATCETLSGEAMEKGIVVRSGYTWTNAGRKVVLKRVLLKVK